MISRAYYSLHSLPNLLVIAILALLLATLAQAQIPDPEHCFATSANTEAVSILMIPNGTGNGLDAAMLFGGSTTDATITVTVMDASGTPIANYPADGLYIGITPDGFPPVCPAGTNADADTNSDGVTTFTAPLRAGDSGAGARIMIGTWPTPEFEVIFPDGVLFQFNSPDIDGDLAVNLTDIVLFTSDFYGTYAYRSDFLWDGQLNLSDIAIFAQAIGAACP